MASNAALGLTSEIADGGVAHFLDTSTAYSSGTLQSWRTNGGEQASIDFEGTYTGHDGVFGGKATVAETLGVTGIATFSGGLDGVIGAVTPAAGTFTNIAGTITTAVQNSVTTMTGLTTIGTLVTGAVPANLVTAATFAAGAFSFAGSTIADLGTVTTANIDGGTIDGTIIGGAVVAAGSFAAIVGTTATLSGSMFVGDTANANMALGQTINQGGSDDQIQAFKSSDVATALTTATLLQDVETDDYVTYSKLSSTLGGLGMQVLAESTAAFSLFLDGYAGAPAITDTTASRGAMNWFVAEHDGANALTDMAANSNGFTWGEIDSGGGRITRMLLKADDGELHLGNTTLVALDDEDDIGLVRSMQWETSKGDGMRTTPWDTSDYGVPAFSYETLLRVGVLGERDEDGNCLFRVQPRFAMNEGAIWQNHVRQRQLESCLRTIIESNDSLLGRDDALQLLGAT